MSEYDRLKAQYDAMKQRAEKDAEARGYARGVKDAIEIMDEELRLRAPRYQAARLLNLVRALLPNAATTKEPSE